MVTMLTGCFPTRNLGVNSKFSYFQFFGFSFISSFSFCIFFFSVVFGPPALLRPFECKESAEDTTLNRAVAVDAMLMGKTRTEENRKQDGLLCPAASGSVRTNYGDQGILSWPRTA